MSIVITGVTLCVFASVWRIVLEFHELTLTSHVSEELRSGGLTVATASAVGANDHRLDLANSVGALLVAAVLIMLFLFLHYTGYWRGLHDKGAGAWLTPSALLWIGLILIPLAPFLTQPLLGVAAPANARTTPVLSLVADALFVLIWAPLTIGVVYRIRVRHPPRSETALELYG